MCSQPRRRCSRNNMSINLSGLTTAKPKKATQEKPILPDPTGALGPMVIQAIDNKKNVDAYEGALTTAKVELGRAAFAHACQLYAGRDSKIEDTFQIGTAGGKALISLKNAYKLSAESMDSAKAALGGQVGNVLKESFIIKVDADAMPGFIQQSFVDELVKVARALDAMLGTPEGQDGAVFQSITVQPVTSVDKAFHEKRYALFTPEQNARLHQVMPCVISIKFDY